MLPVYLIVLTQEKSGAARFILSEIKANVAHVGHLEHLKYYQTDTPLQDKMWSCLHKTLFHVIILIWDAMEVTSYKHSCTYSKMESFLKNAYLTLQGKAMLNSVLTVSAKILLMLGESTTVDLAL